MCDRQPQISVIIPTYNQAHYLDGAIKSVLAQTYPDYELIVVDDGSTDASSQIAARYGNKLRYLYQENQGLAATRNTGIKAAFGNYVAFLDSDDHWKPDFLKNMIALATLEPEATVLYCGWQYMDGKGETLPQRTSNLIPPEQVYAFLLRANFLNACTVLIDKKKISSIDLFDVNFRRLQDWEFWLRLARDGHCFVGTKAIFVKYRLHESNLSADPMGGMAAARAIAMKLFGPEQGDPREWSSDKKRMYGGVYRYHALIALQRQGDWNAVQEYLKKAFNYDPTLVIDINLFYELALGEQPLGFRGTASEIDLDANAEKMTQILGRIFSEEAGNFGEKKRMQAAGTAEYALGLIYYQRKQPARSRHHFLRALKLRPKLTGDRRLMSMLLKSFAGQKGLSTLRRLRYS